MWSDFGWTLKKRLSFRIISAPPTPRSRLVARCQGTRLFDGCCASAHTDNTLPYLSAEPIYGALRHDEIKNKNKNKNNTCHVGLGRQLIGPTVLVQLLIHPGRSLKHGQRESVRERRVVCTAVGMRHGCALMSRVGEAP